MVHFAATHISIHKECDSNMLRASTIKILHGLERMEDLKTRRGVLCVIKQLVYQLAWTIHDNTETCVS